MRRCLRPNIPRLAKYAHRSSAWSEIPSDFLFLLFECLWSFIYVLFIVRQFVACSRFVDAPDFFALYLRNVGIEVFFMRRLYVFEIIPSIWMRGECRGDRVPRFICSFTSVGLTWIKWRGLWHHASTPVSNEIIQKFLNACRAVGR